jgi:hypothetical protein
MKKSANYTIKLDSQEINKPKDLIKDLTLFPDSEIFLKEGEITNRWKKSFLLIFKISSEILTRLVGEVKKVQMYL